MASKQAVLLIHGIGEQRPMDTLRSFVDTVWTSDEDVQSVYAGSDVWSKPDNVSKSFELRRLTTPRNASGVRTDFYEFYWAHLMQGTTYGHLLAWTRNLLLRRPGSVPKHLLTVYWVLIIAAIIAIALAVYAALASQSKSGMSALSPWVSMLLSLAIFPVVGVLLTEVVGDAARYLHVAPVNIQSRHEIRQAGVQILTSLNQQGYDRIIVVGHSLGSVIGYDILYHTWSAMHAQHTSGSSATEALDEVERQATQPGVGDNLDTFRKAQRGYTRELRANGNPWCVTDFITLGSPLAHSAILLAKDAADLESKQNSRELPTCPPRAETIQRDGRPVTRFSYEPGSSPFRIPHHAALFAATRWTNLYFPCRFIVRGDVVGGPLAPWFGSMVRDISVKTRLCWGFFSHTRYWDRPKSGEAPHINALRSALNLLDK